jgi:type IV pilus assembly protein PilN
VIKINLAPPERRRQRIGLSLELPSFNLGVLFAIVYLVAVVGIGVTWLWRSAAESRLIAQVQKDKAELQVLKATIGQGVKIKEQLAGLKARLQAIDELSKSQHRSIALLDAFVDTIPPDLWINTLEDKGAVLKVSGTAHSPTAVSDFMSNLRRSGRFKDIDIIIARQDLAKNPRPVTFEVTCRFEI